MLEDGLFLQDIHTRLNENVAFIALIGSTETERALLCYTPFCTDRHTSD